ncbi:MAG: T9SS type A sorting domain-containing protein, partial [Bacteroidetes bacterium]|nr:T9SS type A sorting domain-containing protein [Bacteroidota bacterium]
KLQGMSDPSAPATNNSTNNVDNFERVDIPNPSGTYTITVTHKGTLTGGMQPYTLIATSQNMSALGVQDLSKNENQISIYPNPAQDFIYFKNNNLVEATVTILDMSGRIVTKEKIQDGRMNVQALTKGEYMAIYKDKKGNELSMKFLKK